MITEIQARGGSVSFREYMELALYHPAHGYYSTGEPRYGRAGDFLTAPTASHWYARVMARALANLAASLGPLRLIEVASGDGSFLVELTRALDEAQQGQSSRRALGSIVSVERSAAMRAVQEQRLQSTIPIEIVDGIDSLSASGRPTVIHACELFDALPVHRVLGSDSGLDELRVRASEGRLEWDEAPATKALARYLDAHGVRLQANQVAEINLEAEPLHRGLLAACGGPGICLVLDYGYEARRLYDARGRAHGSLACYRGHELIKDPLVNPGAQDITAHVNWDDLRRAARSAGWIEHSLCPLAEHLIRAGLAAEIESRGLGMEAELDAQTLHERQEIKRLLDPEGMGSDLKVLVQATPDLLEAASAALGSGVSSGSSGSRRAQR